MVIARLTLGKDTLADKQDVSHVCDVHVMYMYMWDMHVHVGCKMMCMSCACRVHVHVMYMWDVHVV